MSGGHSTPVDSRPRKLSTWFGPTMAFGAVSASWFHFYAVNGSRTEWVDILLDYCHHKRTQYSVFAQGLLRALKVVPK